MKIAVAQINPIIGNLEYNFNLILSFVKKAREQSVNLLVLPELSLIGYPPKDLVLKPVILKRQNHYMDELKLYTDEDFSILVGGISKNEGFGKKYLNSLYFLSEGEIKSVAHKTLLPNYDVFDETRYFEPSKSTTVIDYKGKKIGLSICEDIWIEAYPSMYSKDPITELVSKDAEIIINIAASPFVTDKPIRRKKILANVAKKHNVAIIYANQVGGNDQLIFDGASMLINSHGELVHRLKEFEEDFYSYEISELLLEKQDPNQENPLESTQLEPSIDENQKIDLEKVRKALVLGLRDYVLKSGFKKIILGLSGGIDSALVAVLAVEALGAQNVYTVMMPSRHTSKRSIDDAQKLAKNLNLHGDNFQVLPIEELHQGLSKLIPDMSSLAEENLQSRLRANILMTLSNTHHSMLLNTGNKSELAVGYCTLYGDTCGGIGVIADLLKTTVYRLSEHINSDAESKGKKAIIPNSIITKAPSAELKPNQTDQDTLPEYDLLDQIIMLYVQEMKSFDEIVEAGFDPETVAKILNLIDRNEYKRQQAPMPLKVTGKAFGQGRRMPIAQGFEHKKQNGKA